MKLILLLFLFAQLSNAEETRQRVTQTTCGRMDYQPKPAYKGDNITLSFSANTSINISHMHWRQYCLNNTDRNITKSDEQFVLNKNETEWSLVLINWTMTYCNFTVEIYTGTDNDTSQCNHKDFFLLVHTTEETRQRVTKSSCGKMDYTPKPAHKGKNITLSFSANTSISISHMHWRQYCLNNTDRNITKSDEQFVLNKNETEWSLVLINWTITYCDFTVEIYTDTDNDTSQCKHKDFFLLVHTTAFDDTEDAGLPFKNASQGISNGEFTELHERSGDREEYPQSNANRDHTIKSSSKIDRNPVEVKSSQQIDNKQTIKLDEQDTLHDTDLDQPGSKNDTTLDQSGSKYDTSLVQSGSKYDTSLVQSGSPEVEPTDKPSSTSTSRIGVNDEGNLFTDEKSKTRDKDAPRITPEQSVPASLSPNKGAPPVYVSTFLPIRPNKSATTRTTTVHMLPEVEQTDKPSPTKNEEELIGTENVHNDDFNDTTDGGRMDNKQAKTTKQEDMHHGIDPITAKDTKEGVTESPSADQTSPSLNGINDKVNLSTDEKSKTRDKDASRITKSTGPPNLSRKPYIGSTYMYDNTPEQSVPTSLSPNKGAPPVYVSTFLSTRPNKSATTRTTTVHMLPEVEQTDKPSTKNKKAIIGTENVHNDDFNDTTDGGRMDNKQAKTTKQEDMHHVIYPITAKDTKEGVTETPSADQTSPSLNGINTKGNLSTDEKSKTRDKDASRISKSTGPPNTSRKLRIGSTYMYDNRPGQSVPTSLSPDEDAPLVLPEVEPTDKRSPTKNQASTGTGEFSGDSDIEDEDITVSIQEAATVGSDNVEPIQTTELASDKWALIIILLTVALVIACLDAVLIALICVGKRGSASFDVSDGNSSRKDGVKLTTMRPLREVKIGSGVSEPVFSQVGRSHFSFEDESRVGTSKQMETPEITVEDNRTGIYESRETNRTVVCYSGETNPREIGTFGQGDVQQLDRVLRGF